MDLPLAVLPGVSNEEREPQGPKVTKRVYQVDFFVVCCGGVEMSILGITLLPSVSV